MRVALYARFSSDLQRQTSIEDQLRAARARAAAEGWQIVAERSDSAVSGSTPFALRPGSKALLADALSGRFDVLIVEGLDRTFRDVGEQEQVIKRLEHRGIRVIGTSDGYDTQAKGRKVMRIARGLVNELYLDDLADKTRRGLAGQFGRGLSAGGRSYGYRTEAASNGRRMVIDEAEAAHVRWMFERHAEGWSPVSLAHELNRLGVPAPRGGTWAVSAIFGTAQRGLGILNNQLYIGRVLWNRRQWLKDPETGARRYVERPESEWLVRDAPELRIISDQLWEATRQRIHPKGDAIAAATRGARAPRTLFGGLLVCATCGGAVVAVDARRYGCSVHKDRGPAACASENFVPRKAVDTRLLAVVKEEMEAPEVIAAVQHDVRMLVAEHQRAADAPEARWRLADVEQELGRLVDALAQVGFSPMLGERIRALETERAKLQQQAAQAVIDDADGLAEAVVARYRAAMLELRRRLDTELDRTRTRELLRQMLGPITLRQDAQGATWAEMTNPASQLAAGGVALLPVVAGARNMAWRRVRVWG
jgi:DNA invertase Pin-like site-specific DNA recombinase